MAKQTSKPETEVFDTALAGSDVTPKENVRTQRKQKPGIDPSEQVEVRNNTFGRLVYSSPRMMGYTIVWDAHGDVQLMDYSEVQTMKNAFKRFFVNNWVTIDDPDVVEALGVSGFYKESVNGSNINELFSMSPSVIRKRVSAMNDGLKATVRAAAKQAVDDGILDSMKRIKALEESLDCSLM